MEIFHVARSADWDAALETGDYRISTVGRTLAEEGFVHCAFREQVAGVVERFYGGVPGALVVLAVDTDRLAAELRLEDSGAGELFPHVYGPVEVDAVRSVTPLERF